MADLTVELLRAEARAFAEIESGHDEPTLYGVTDGKAIGTYFEQKFQAYLLFILSTTTREQGRPHCLHE